MRQGCMQPASHNLHRAQALPSAASATVQRLRRPHHRSSRSQRPPQVQIYNAQQQTSQGCNAGLPTCDSTQASYLIKLLLYTGLRLARIVYFAHYLSNASQLPAEAILSLNLVYRRSLTKISRA